MNSRSALLLICLAVCFLAISGPGQAAPPKTQPRVWFEQNDTTGSISVRIGDRLAFSCRYGHDLDLPHIYPVKSPSGKDMIVEQTEPYPHHRGFWFADKIRFNGKQGDLYNSLYSGTGGSRKPYKPYHPPFRDHIRHIKFTNKQPGIGTGSFDEDLVWVIDTDKTALDDHRSLRITALADGTYFLDITYRLTASYGPVEFISDAVHYAWPYIRMNKTFSVDGGGGTITNSEGGINQAGTHDKVARWVDYSNTVDGVTEGIAIFSHPSDGYPHKWLTRDYGCFGPRRPDERSGKPFTLKKGATISQRVGVLVHTGDVSTGRVAERYSEYVGGKL